MQQRQNYSAFDLITRDKGLQEHWLRRFVAIIIDAIIIAVVVWILFLLVAFSTFVTGFYINFFIWPFTTGVILLLYSAMLENLRGATIGKELLRLRVVSHRGRIDIGKALMRNISKIFWILLLLDLLVGFLTVGNDPRQRWLDRIVGTTVESVQQPTQFTGAARNY